MILRKNQTLIVAEIGINHNGNVNIAKKLIDRAKACGADVVKFQIYKTRYFLTNNYSYLDKKKLKNFKTMKKILSQNELTYEDFKILKKYCIRKKIKFAATPFDLNSYFFLKSLKPYFIKLASADLNNFELLNQISKDKFPLILSTGMSNQKEIDLTINFLKKKKFKNLSLMHCVSVYPTPLNLVNLRSISYLKKKYNFKIGLSDHSSEIDVPVYAVVLGATIIEKHFTLDNKMKGPDHKASLSPENFLMMVDKIRKLEKILGYEKKEKNKIEKNIEWIAKRSIYAKNQILKGSKFTEKNVIFLRPKIKYQRIQIDKIYNLKAKKNFSKGELIS